MFQCRVCGEYFEVRIGNHPEYCPFCGKSEVERI